MQDLMITFLKEVNILQLAGMGVMFWFFYTRLEKKLDKLDAKIDKVDGNLSSRMDRLDSRMDKLTERVDVLDRKLCRLEGTLQYHGYCFFQQEQTKKAE